MASPFNIKSRFENTFKSFRDVLKGFAIVYNCHCEAASAARSSRYRNDSGMLLGKSERLTGLLYCVARFFWKLNELDQLTYVVRNNVLVYWNMLRAVFMFLTNVSVYKNLLPRASVVMSCEIMRWKAAANNKEGLVLCSIQIPKSVQRSIVCAKWLEYFNYSDAVSTGW